MDFFYLAIFTIIPYLFVPFILVVTKRKMSICILRIIIILNGFFVWVLFNLVRVFIGDSPSSNVIPAFLWSSIGYFWVKKSCLKENDTVKENNFCVMSQEILDEEKHISDENNFFPKCDNSMKEYEKNLYDNVKLSYGSKKVVFSILLSLIIIFVVGLFCGYYYPNKKIAELEEKISLLENENANLSSEYTILSDEYDLIYDDYIIAKEKYSKSSYEEYVLLSNEYDLLLEKYNWLKDNTEFVTNEEYNSLSEEYDLLFEEYNKLIEENKVSKKDLAYTEKQQNNVPSGTLVYSGTGNQVIKGINAPEGNYYITTTHDGVSNCCVNFYSDMESYGPLIANLIGKGSEVYGYVGTIKSGYMNIIADGNWTITIERAE